MQRAKFSDRRMDLICAALCTLLPALPFLPLLLPARFLIYRDIFPYLLPICKVFAEAPSGLVTWDSFVQCGQSLSGNPMGFSYYPFFRIALLSGTWGSVVFMILAHYLLLGLAAYLFLRVGLRLRPLAALLGGTTLAGGGYLVSMAPMFQFTSVPWLLLTATCWLRLAVFPSRSTPARAGYAAGVAAFASLAVLGGQLQEVLICVFALAGITLWPVLVFYPQLRWRPKRLQIAAKRAAPLLVLIVLICALPMAERYGDARAGRRLQGLPMNEITDWSTRPSRILDLVLPYRFGAPHAPGYAGAKLNLFDGKSVAWAPSIYLGLASLLLLGGAVRRRYAWVRTAVWIGLLLALVMALGKYTPLFGLTLKVLPLLRAFQYPEKYLLAASVAMAVLAALAFDNWLHGRGKRAPILLGAAAVVVLFLTVWASWLNPTLETAHSPLLSQSLLRQSLLFSLFFAVQLGLLLAGCGGNAARRTILAAALCFFAAADLLLAHGHDPIAVRLRANPLTQPDPLLARVAADMTGPFDRLLYRVATRIEKFEVDSGDPLDQARLLALSGGGPALYGLRTTGGLYPNVSRRYDYFTQTLNRHAPLLFWRISASRYILIETSLIQGRPEDAGFEPLASDDALHLTLQRNRNALPRLTFFRRWTTADSPQQALNRMQELWKSGAIRNTLIIETETPPAPVANTDATTPPGCEITALTEQSGRLRAEIATDAPGFVYFAENWHRHWHAALDGQSTAILPAYGLFMAVWVPAPGTHTLEFEFR